MTVATNRVEEEQMASDQAPQPQPMITFPVSDPSALTTDQLRRETRALRELVSTRLDAMDKAVQLLQATVDRQPTPSVLQERTVALEKVVEQKFQTIEKQLASAAEIEAEKFEGVARQFIERDERTEQLSIADKTAIAAALQAQKEAAGATNESNSVALTKMEGNFTKLIDQGQALIASVVKNTDEKINDLKSRLDRGEGKTSVSDPAVADGLRSLKDMVASLASSRDGGAAAAAAKTAQTSFLIAVVVAAVSVAGLGLTIVSRMGAPTAAVISRDEPPSRLSERNADLLQRLEERLNALPAPNK
jgi:hypothetical protein